MSPNLGRTKDVTKITSQPKQNSQPDQKIAASPAPLPTSQPLTTGNTGKESPVITRPNEQKATEQSITVRSLPPLDTRRDWIDYTQIGLTLLLFAVAIWQIVLLRHTLRATTTAAKAARANASAASANARATEAYVIAANKSANAADRSVGIMETQRDTLDKQHAAIVQQAGYMADGLAETRNANATAAIALLVSQRAERAYISISHSSKGLQKQNPPLETPGRQVVLRISNGGKTPAKIDGGIIELTHKHNLKAVPFAPNTASANPGPTRIVGTFLHAGGTYPSTNYFYADEYSGRESQIKNGEMYLAGYVEYTDIFKVRHRAGYCRRVIADEHVTAGQTNLRFDHISAPHNYDIEIDDEGQPKQKSEPEDQS
jgi:hypothetical protein